MAVSSTRMTKRGVVVPDEAPELYRYAATEQWQQVIERAELHSMEASYVHPADNTTALHLAAKAKRASYDRIDAVRCLLIAYPEAACVQEKTSLGLTPLHYACMIPNDKPSTVDDSKQMVKLMLEYNVESVHVCTNDGQSPLDIHTKYVSKAKRKVNAFDIPGITNKRRSKSRSRQKSTSCTGILSKLLDATIIATVRSSKTNATMNTAKALDLLLECNSLEVLENVALEEAQASSLKLRARRMARSDSVSVVSRASTIYTTGSTNFAHFWVWEWAVLILKNQYKRRMNQQQQIHSNLKMDNPASSSPVTPPFCILHEAARAKDCPLPILMLAIRAFPEDLRAPDTFTGNYPLHFIAGWRVSSSDEKAISRKSMALSAFVTEFPEATKFQNKQGKTPLSLALETGTSWDNGVRRLTTFQNQQPSSDTGTTMNNDLDAGNNNSATRVYSTTSGAISASS
eukprot:CAMPEP_0195292612 /NCGR_PEP_ID=MMETSP0707-20130614/10291_1 /TAXON_ID=33640 /ORGANISM="Asterionellopsis glacialis, Strain CCMP134" /LENGTH=457 /DNA_ID=CAMNT_0040353123 /DNA_START=57 /DNA_END=1427 /DNA_ORIENTATION=-